MSHPVVTVLLSFSQTFSAFSLHGFPYSILPYLWTYISS